MLRIDWKAGRIPTDFRDPYLELVHLLTDAAALEHSLMIAYLYALFSVKDEYAHVRGDIRTRSFLEHSPAGRGGTEVLRHKQTFLDVALEEMQHLSLVNRYLVDLGAAPNFTPHDFPYTSDLYPFDIELRSLDQYVAATYVWIEADQCALSLRPHCAATRQPVATIKAIRRVLKTGSERYHQLPIDEEQLDHVGSLYRRVLQLTQTVAANPPPTLGADFPWGEWESRMQWILFQGELSHFQFFLDVFTGKAFGAAERIWRHGPKFPAHVFKQGTAFTARPHTIPDERVRRVAWLADLHYWIILSLLDVAYRSRGFAAFYSAPQLAFQYKAIDNMTQGLWLLGLHLASAFETGVPFDSMGPQYGLGRSPDHSKALIVRLVDEAQRVAQELDQEGLLSPGFDLGLYQLTLNGLQPATAAQGSAP
jgi:hypothetical protein